ncbi:hypothetical protein [Ligilactobacillus aviarius]|uniref:hypothetical protein n=1 Tax=Ligilactobacillus aviarius TaxID=1606 RepID=UPI0024B88569|nr:hypothetical protein [Ligilactobacillus aviarius]
MTSDAQKRAARKWDEHHQERRKYLSWRLRARSFIEKAVTPEDLIDLKKLIDDRLGDLGKDR